jgi:hypothetical protein
MAESDRIESIVERIVGEVLASHTAQLREEIVHRVAQEAGNLIAAQAANGASSELVRAVTEIQAGTSQKEILKALLDSCARFAARAALFVVKGSSATGWQGRGFSNDDAVKNFALDATVPAVRRAIEDQTAVRAKVEELDQHFLEQFGNPVDGEARLLPLLLKDKVAAVVYADGGSEGSAKLDAGSLELLVLGTSSWLEINSLRKQTQKAPSADEAQTAQTGVTPTVVSAASYSDPFAAHAPTHAMAAAAAAGPAAVAATQIEAEVGAVSGNETEPALETAPPPEAPPSSPGGTPEDQETHRKAQRFARLLIDEIKLYNQARVAEGRKNKDLYHRLKDAIEKSRGTYQKRYGNTVAASSDYFQHELIRSLAEDDISIMGVDFPH